MFRKMYAFLAVDLPTELWEIAAGILDFSNWQNEKRLSLRGWLGAFLFLPVEPRGATLGFTVDVGQHVL